MQQLNRILQIFLFHLTRRIVNRLPMALVIVLTVLVIAVMLALPHLSDWGISLGPLAQ
ncbi:hypothetical protein [Aquibaculum sediminis]|uniref:hypothetical protein n=1 Tax=Aquibaculum sediminis TaxID=3231907 RepID=UPI003452867B